MKEGIEKDPFRKAYNPKEGSEEWKKAMAECVCIDTDRHLAVCDKHHSQAKHQVLDEVRKWVLDTTGDDWVDKEKFLAILKEMKK